MSSAILIVHSPTSSISSERHFSLVEPISTLRGRLEHMTGIPPSSQILSLWSSRTDDPGAVPPPTLIKRLSREQDDDLTLGQLGAREGMGIKVEDDRPEDVAKMFSDESNVQKFELTDEEYKNRSDTVLAFKQRHKLGRFDPNAIAAAENSATATSDAVVEAQATISLGSRCQVAGEAQRRGVVRFVGEADFAKGVWVGIEYDEPVGKNDGSVDGKKYFSCPNKHGGFVRPEKVSVGDYPPLGLEGEDEDLEEL